MMRRATVARLEALESHRQVVEYCSCPFTHETYRLAIAHIAPEEANQPNGDNCPRCGKPLALVFRHWPDAEED